MIRNQLHRVTAILGVLGALGCSDPVKPIQGPVTPGAQTVPPPAAPMGMAKPPAAPAAGVAGAGSTMQTPPGMMMAPPAMVPPMTPPADMMPAPGEMPGEMPAPSAPVTGNCESSTLMPGDTNKTVMIAGTSRSYIVHVPPMYDGKKPLPLMFNFHPLTGSASNQRSGSGWAQLGDTEGFITTFLNGIGGQWDLGKLTRPGNDENDRMFAVAVLDALSKEGCIDMKRVYASGYSMGGGMTHYLGCREGAKFAAIAPSAFDLIEENQPCEPGRPMTVIMFRGMGDGIVMWQPSVGTLTGAPASFLGAIGCFQEWARINGCEGEPEMGERSCQTYTKCQQGVKVTLCENGGHTQGDAMMSWAAIKDYSLP